MAVLMDVPDLDAFAKAMQSPAAADAMAYDGVVPEFSGGYGRIERVRLGCELRVARLGVNFEPARASA